MFEWKTNKKDISKKVKHDNAASLRQIHLRSAKRVTRTQMLTWKSDIFFMWTCAYTNGKILIMFGHTTRSQNKKCFKFGLVRSIQSKGTMWYGRPGDWKTVLNIERSLLMNFLYSVTPRICVSLCLRNVLRKRMDKFKIY